MNVTQRLHVILATLLALSPSLIVAQDGDIQAGQAIYEAQMCNLCHTLGGKSGAMAHVGGVLDQLATRRDADWIERYIRNPQSVIPKSQMPKTTLTDREIRDLIAFLLAQ
jgi:cytochrome c2